MEVGAPKVTSGDNLVKETTSARENIKPMVPVEGNKKGWWVNTVNNQQPLIQHDLQVSEVDGVVVVLEEVLMSHCGKIFSSVAFFRQHPM